MLSSSQTSGKNLILSLLKDKTLILCSCCRHHFFFLIRHLTEVMPAEGINKIKFLIPWGYILIFWLITNIDMSI